MPSKPHLLYVAWGFPPCRGSGVYRAWATANAFAEAGWQVTVLTAPRETFTMSTGIDASLEATVDPRIEIVRVPFIEPKFAHDLRAWSSARANQPELWNGWYSRIASRAFPEPKYGAWRPALEKAAREIHGRTPVDLVIGTGNPHVDFTPGWLLHQRDRVPYVIDYRDAWQLDVFGGERLTPAGGPVDRWETKLMGGAEAVWFVNDPIRRWHQDLHPAAADRMHVVSNGYDLPFTFTRPADAAEDGLVFGYVGTLTGAVPLDRLIAGWRLARSRSELLSRSRIELWGHLNHTAIPSEVIARQLAEYADNDIAYMGPVAKQEIEDVYRRFDALLLVLGTGRYVTSGKVFEYAATGSPIVAVHDPGNAAAEVLEDAPHRHSARDLSDEAIADALIAAAAQASTWTDQDRANAREWAEQFHRDRQLAPQIDALREAALRQRAARSTGGRA